MAKKKIKDEDMGWNFEEQGPFPVVEEEMSWDFSDSKDVGPARHGQRRFQVTLEYDSTKTPSIADLIREAISSKGIITEKHQDMEYLSHVFHNLGNVPAWIMGGNTITDRWYEFIYAAETLRGQPQSVRNLGISSLHTTYRQHKEWGPDEEQVEVDGRSWGGDDRANPPKPVREQMAEQKEKAIADNQAEARPAALSDGSKAEDAYIAKWAQAERLARNPRASWEGKCDLEMEMMIKYCYAHLADTGTVERPSSFDDLFWQKELPHHSVRLSEKAQVRRQYISGEIMQFWQKAMMDPEIKAACDLKRRPLSYRVTMQAMKLAKLIEMYAGYAEDPDPIHGDDKSVRKLVKKAAMKYLEAHYPIKGKPGPLKTLDPGYAEYLQICRKYALPEGTLLHKADL